MLTVVWSPKGGVGVSVITAALAVTTAAAGSSPADAADGTPAEVLLVDLCGDLPAVLGIARPSGPGCLDWMRSRDHDPAALTRLAVPVIDGVRVVPAGALVQLQEVPDDGVRALDAALEGSPHQVIVDLGVVREGSAIAGPLLAIADRSLMVVRPCYLALRAAIAVDPRPDGVVVVEEPGRALVARDVAEVVGVPVVATVPLDPAVARAVDAGVLARRVPSVLSRALAELA